MVNSNLKGKTGERDWVAFLKKNQLYSRRTQQYCGKTDESADCIGLKGIHQEVKRVERLNIAKAMSQSITDSKDKKLMPIVAHRISRGPWLVTMTAEDWINIYKEWIENG